MSDDLQIMTNIATLGSIGFLIAAFIPQFSMSSWEQRLLMFIYASGGLLFMLSCVNTHHAYNAMGKEKPFRQFKDRANSMFKVAIGMYSLASFLLMLIMAINIFEGNPPM